MARREREVLGRAVENWAKSRGATRAFLNTYRGSPTAVPFYEKRRGCRPKILGVLEAAAAASSLLQPVDRSSGPCRQ
jgi:hypothetical protein